MADNLAFDELRGAGFVDRDEKPVKVMKVSGGPRDVAALMYQCRLNRDVDGAADTYGWNNPEGLNTAKDKTLQVNLDPKDGLGTACESPGDGTKGWQNFDARA